MTTKPAVTMTTEQLSTNCNACCLKTSPSCVTCHKQSLPLTCYISERKSSLITIQIRDKIRDKPSPISLQISDEPTEVVIGDIDVVRKLGVEGAVKKPVSKVLSGDKLGFKTGNTEKKSGSGKVIKAGSLKVVKSGSGKVVKGGSVKVVNTSGKVVNGGRKCDLESLDSIFNGIQLEVERSVLLCDKVLGKLGKCSNWTLM